MGRLVREGRQQSKSLVAAANARGGWYEKATCGSADGPIAEVLDGWLPANTSQNVACW